MKRNRLWDHHCGDEDYRGGNGEISNICAYANNFKSSRINADLKNYSKNSATVSRGRKAFKMSCKEPKKFPSRFFMLMVKRFLFSHKSSSDWIHSVDPWRHNLQVKRKYIPQRVSQTCSRSFSSIKKRIVSGSLSQINPGCYYRLIIRTQTYAL